VAANARFRRRIGPTRTLGADSILFMTLLLRLFAALLERALTSMSMRWEATLGNVHRTLQARIPTGVKRLWLVAATGVSA
jgi:hypothetical protein